MKTRNLKGKYEIGEVGLGCWQLGADWGDSPEKDAAFAILNEAIENGVNFFDTADVYGNGRSERYIGEFIKTINKKVFIATKYGRSAEVYPDNYTEKNLRSSVEGSLQRLGVNSLDLLQLHCIPFDVIKEGKIFTWLRKIKNEGLIKEFGASVETVEQGMTCLEQEDICSLQVIFNIFRQKPLEKLFPEAKRQGVGIIVRLPLASGLLTGKFSKATEFAENDHRNFNRDGESFNVGETFAGLSFERGLELVDQIEKKYKPEELSMVQLALRWILDQEAVTTIIPGASSPKQAKSNARVSNLEPLSTDIHKRLGEFYQKEVHHSIRAEI